MGTKNQSDEIKEQARTYWRAGRSQRWIALELNVSASSINSWVKGTAQDLNELVNTKTIVLQQENQLSAQERSAVQEIVDERTKHIEFFTNAAVKNVRAAMLKPCEGQADYRMRADTILKGKETVLGKQPDTAIQINNSVENVTAGAKDELRARLLKRGMGDD